MGNYGRRTGNTGEKISILPNRAVGYGSGLSIPTAKRYLLVLVSKEMAATEFSCRHFCIPSLPS